MGSSTLVAYTIYVYSLYTICASVLAFSAYSCPLLITYAAVEHADSAATRGHGQTGRWTGRRRAVEKRTEKEGLNRALPLPANATAVQRTLPPASNFCLPCAPQRH